MLNTRNKKYTINRGIIAEKGSIPLGLNFIQDTWQFTPISKTMTENINGDKVTVMEGLFQEGDAENANGRIYPSQSVLMPAVKNIQEDIAARAVVGELDHPDSAKVNLDRVSHLISKVWMEGNKVYGKAEILHKLPFGAYLRGLFEHKVRIGISSRGVGDMELVESSGRETYRVQEGFTFVTWDVVHEPSVTNAIMNIREGLTRKIKPISEKRSKFSPEVYQDILVKEINNFFGLK